MKTLVAKKVKDGWYVEITDFQPVPTEVDVKKLAREYGLKIKPEFGEAGKRIYAE